MVTPPASTVNIEDEMRQSYMDYAMSVIVGRALPDVRDGMKPVQRRVLFAMFSEGLVSNRKHSKCAGVVGEVLKRFHPHGDSSVYEALVRLAQPWVLRYQLVDGQGNFGSIDGDPPAAYRYTECRMTAIAERMLEDINKDTVDFVPNFDDSTTEPVVLPAVVPNLLVNGAAGIAVGMATHMPPHNLGEIIDATVEYIENPEVTVDQLLMKVPGPDFPTGGLIYGRSGIRSGYATGRGSLSLRARTHVERIKTGTREVDAIVVTEIPYQVNKSRLIERIADLVNGKEIEGISRLRDETDRQGIRVVIELKRDATPEVVLNQLFKSTPLQVSFGIINLAIVEGEPVICSLKQLIKHFVDHRRDVVTRRTQFELKQARERMHILEGFRIALLNLDDVISLIKGSESGKEAREGLMVRYELTAVQAQAILDLRLQKLTGLERLAIEREHEELQAEIERLASILADTRKVDAMIVAELSSIREQFADKRRTEIVEEAGEILIEDMIEDEEMAVTISHQGYIRRTPLNVYREQKRGGRGITGASSKDEDFIEHLFVASALSDVLVFTSLGRAYWLKVYEIPESGRTARGRALVNLLNLKEEEKISAILPIRQSEQNQYVVMATREGVIKKTPLADFTRRNKLGVIACSLNEGDILIGAALSTGSDDIMLSSEHGMVIRFKEKHVRDMGRTARGVRGIALEDGDHVVSMAIVTGAETAEEVAPVAAELPEDTSLPLVESPGSDLTFLTVCQGGFGKRTPLSQYRITGRGGKGIIDIQTSDRNGPVVGAFIVPKEAGLMLITTSGKVIRLNAQDIRVVGRNTRGVKLINLEEGETVVAIAHVVDAGEESEVEVKE